MKFEKRLLILLLCALAACDSGIVPKEQREEAVGIFKSSMFDPLDWQHVATIHGWADDLEVCEEIIEFLNEEEPNRYVCDHL